MKTFEYFYLSKPVIATPIEELRKFSGLIKIGSSFQDWQLSISSLLNQQWPKTNQRQQRKLALANSWKEKIAAIADTIGNSEKGKQNL